MNRNAISLFSSSGIGDLGLHANGVKTVIACELLEERASLFRANNPDSKVFNGDIWDLKDDIVRYYKENLKESPFLILATPPCQGMSSNGMGTMLRNYKNGQRPKFDERNRLIIPSLDIIAELKPEWVIFENVPNMVNTVIYDDNDELVNIIDYIYKRLGDDYVGCPNVIDVADYGVPQHRKRLISIFTKDEKGKDYYRRHKTFIPDKSHLKESNLMYKKWVALCEVIGNLPRLSSRAGENECKDIPLHRVPVLDDIKLSWISNTPEGQTAFNNQCVNPECGYKGNPTHGSFTDNDGVSRAKTETPLYCERCGSLLPRPYVEDKRTGEKRIMKAFTSAYKRMKWDEPCSTLTQNFQYACSDNKIHPTQDRVLSLYEGLLIQTIADYPYSFEIDGVTVNDGLIRDTIGESVPPLVIDKIVKNILKIVG